MPVKHLTAPTDVWQQCGDRLNRGPTRARFDERRVHGWAQTSVTSWALWAVAVFASVAGLAQLVKSVTFPRVIAEHPVRTEATVTAVYINGLGGDTAVDYRYTVAGHVHTGSGNGGLGDEDLSSLRPGDRVAIEYAARSPSQSCSCDAVHELPVSIPIASLAAAILALPLAFLLVRSVPRWYRKRRSWFAPVHGLGEWIGFVGGILVAIAFLLITFAYFVASSVGG